ncbi:MAG: hypothetical protein J6I64_00845, partial [Lachnospiraceae bacterium]|nr:hypothetical protein [Lachnospiraceae bacterium]
LEEDLAQIAEDGFNSIILAIPWREFQPQMDPVVYNDYALKQLDRVMAAAKAQGLWVSLRVGYTWDYWEDGTDVRARFREVMGDGTVLAAWDDYVKTIYERANAHGNLYGGFLTWEDFWSFTYYATEQGRGEDSMYWAQLSGYTDYVRQNYTLAEISQLYGEEITDFDKLYLPEKDQPALKLVYEFFDVWLNEFLLHNQEIFPDLSMEVRMDMDLVYDENGQQYWYGHENTFTCGDSSYVSLMYGVPMGHINQGERLEAAEALVTSQQMLDHVLQYTEGKKLYIEQFLYMDNTPGFEHNAQVKEDQVDDYIIAMADILKDRVMGYGVWAYQNYADNLLYNPQFALGEIGWTLEGGAQVVEYHGSMQAQLPVGGCVYREISRGTTLTHVRFTVDGEAPVKLQVSLGSDTIEVNVDADALGAGNAIELVFENGGDGLRFTADAPCYIDNVKVYNRVHEGQLYSLDGEELSCIEAIRKLNRKLK